MMQSESAGRAGGKFLGFPIDGFGLFTSLLLSLATGFFTFFVTTFLAIFVLLAWNALGGHSVSYVDTYRYVGFPAGIAALFVALLVFGTLWIRAKLMSAKSMS